MYTSRFRSTSHNTGGSQTRICVLTYFIEIPSGTVQPNDTTQHSKRQSSRLVATEVDYWPLLITKHTYRYSTYLYLKKDEIEPSAECRPVGGVQVKSGLSPHSLQSFFDRLQRGYQNKRPLMENCIGASCISGSISFQKELSTDGTAFFLSQEDVDQRSVNGFKRALQFGKKAKSRDGLRIFMD